MTKTEVKVKKRSKFKYRQVFTVSDLLMESYSVRTITGRILINLGNGYFVDRDNPQYINSLDLVYRNAKTVMNGKHKLLARRLQTTDGTRLRRIVSC
ncbi:hypothetical protein [Latilactobacillus fragifolii]|uniref:hypothetical protein n=1 Tax=Latilactobacillus fragifolii TaxID=2814244 RepID=UPI001ABAAB52|nr:hypothetical protein [Latilactobacillus fragifolii]